MTLATIIILLGWSTNAWRNGVDFSAYPAQVRRLLVSSQTYFPLFHVYLAGTNPSRSYKSARTGVRGWLRPPIPPPSLAWSSPPMPSHAPKHALPYPLCQLALAGSNLCRGLIWPWWAMAGICTCQPTPESAQMHFHLKHICNAREPAQGACSDSTQGLDGAVNGSHTKQAPSHSVWESW